MSDSDSDGGPGLDDFMWGNLGEGDRLEVDYMPQDAVGSLKAVANQTQLGAELQHEVKDGAGSSAAAGSGGSAGHNRFEYIDEPTLSEDLEDDEFPVLRPAAAAPAAAGPAQLGAAAAAAAAYGQQVAGEDDYDDDDEPAAAGAAAAAAVNMPALMHPQQLQAQQLQSQQLQSQQLQSQQLQSQQLQQQLLQQQQQAAALQLAAGVGFPMQQQYAGLPQQQLLHPAAVAAGAQPPLPQQQQQQQAQQPVLRRPQLTPEQERLRALNRATPAQEAEQEALSFRYLDLDQLGEDIVHFSELYVPTDNQIKNAYLQSFARVPPSEKQHHDQPWERARQRADAMLNRHYQQKALQQAGADADVADDDSEKFHRGDTAVAAAEGNVVQLGLQNIRLEVVEELSEAEEELFASDPQGLGRAMLQAARLNAARAAAKAAAAAVKAAQAKAAATAGDTDAAAEAAAEAAAAEEAAASARLQGVTAGLQGLGLKGLAVNPHALDALQADILPHWEQEVFWGSSTAPPPLPSQQLLPSAALASLQQQQQQQQTSGFAQQAAQQQGMPLTGSLGLPGMPSMALPGMSSAMSGLPPGGQGGLGLPPAHTGLAGGSFPAAGGVGSILPGASGGLPSQGTGGADAMGQWGSTGMGQLDPAAAAAMPDPAAAAVAAAAGEGGGEQGRGAPKGKGARLGKPRRPLPAALAELKLHRQMLRLMPSIAAAAATQAAAEAVDAAAAAAAAAAASGDRAAAAALPQRWGGGSQTGSKAGTASAEAAAAADQLKLMHVGELLQRDLKPVLPDDDDWMNDIVWDAEEGTGPGTAAGSMQQQLARTVSSLGAAGGLLAEQQQQALVLRQQGGGGRTAVLWDLNDPYMVFEAASTQPYINASAMMHPVPAQAAVPVPPHLATEKDPLLRQLAPLHISRDYLYQATERTSGRAVITGRHSALALQLTTVPVFPKDAMTMFWHRPRSFWSAAHFLESLEVRRRNIELQMGRDPDCFPETGPYMFEPVGLNLRKCATAQVEKGTARFRDIWEFIERQPRFKDAFSIEAPLMRSYGPGYNFAAVDEMWMGSWLTDQAKSLAELGFRHGINYVIPVWTLLSPLRTKEVAVLQPPNVPCRPPAALKTLKTLSASTPGHVLLLEYLEERPLMMLQTGMGMRLTTYYRRRNDSDMHYQALQAEYSEGLLHRQALPLTSTDGFESRPPWMVGTAQLLTPDDPSPFYELAPIPPGEMQFAVDTPCFRAPAVPHVASYTDFLLARLPGGNIALREITGCVAVGQQHPSVSIWAPGSEQAVAYERARFKVWVIRTLRTRADRPAVKAGKDIPSVSLQELQAPTAFGRMSIGPNPTELMRLLQEECQCIPVPEKPGHWTFMPNAKLPNDQDLKKMVTPDQAVQYEALLAGLGQRDSWHIGACDEIILKQLSELPAGPATTLRLVLDMLLPDTAGRQAAAAIEQCVLNNPWAQSAAYQASLVSDVRNPAALTLVGRGDPTGRGRGFAFVRDDPKRAKEEAAPPPGVQAAADGTITGTGADLRRLSHKRAGEILETKFGMDASVVAGIARWDRIDTIRRAVRDPANAALVNSDPELQQWVRNIKMSAEDMRSKMRNTAAPIFAKQMNALLEPWDDGAESADLTWGLPQQLAGAVAADTEADTATSGMRAAAADKLQAAKDSMDSAAIAAATDAYNRAMDQPALPLGSGLFYGPAKSFDLQPIHRGTTAASRSLPKGYKPVPGERRIRRVIKYCTGNQSFVTRIMYIYSREEMAALNALYKSGDGFGSRNIMPAADKKSKYSRAVPLGATFQDHWPTIEPDLPPLPAAEQAPAAAAAPAGSAPAGAASAAYWADPSTQAAGYAAYAPAQDAMAWAPAQPVMQAAAPRAPKLSKKQLQKQKELERKRAQAVARKGAKKRRRGDDYEFSEDDDDDFEMSESEESEQGAAVPDDDDSDGGPSRRAKARPQRTAAASGGGTEAAAAAAPAAAASGGVAAAVAPMMAHAAPPDQSRGAADVPGIGENMLIPLTYLNNQLEPAYTAMYKFQNSKRRMGLFLVDCFVNHVSPQILPDYANVVPLQQQMWLGRIRERLSRKYYSSRQQFLADAQQIHTAASSYHRAGRGQIINIKVPGAAAAMVDEARRVLEEPAIAQLLDYWEGRIKIEEIRNQGPAAWQQYFQGILATAQQHYNDTGADMNMWHWVECEECKKWRLISEFCYLIKNFGDESTPFKCRDNVDWPAPSCDEPAHWKA